MKILITEQQLEIIKNGGNGASINEVESYFKKLNNQIIALLKDVFYTNLYDLVHDEININRYKETLEKYAKLNDKYDEFIMDLEKHDDYNTLSRLQIKNSKNLDYLDDLMRKLENIADLDRTPKIIKILSNDNTINI